MKTFLKLCGAWIAAALLFSAPVHAQDTLLGGAGGYAVAGGGAVIADAQWLQRSDTHLALDGSTSNASGHNVTLSTPEPGFANTVVIADTCFAKTDKRFWFITVTNNAGGNAGTLSGLATTSVGSGAGVNIPFGMSHSGASVNSTGGNTFGLNVGTNPAIMAWDGSRQAFFIYSAGLPGWGGSSGGDDPTSSPTTGGAIPNFTSGTPICPALQFAQDPTSVTINGGAQTYDATLATQVGLLKGNGFKELGAP